LTWESLLYSKILLKVLRRKRVFNSTALINEYSSPKEKKKITNIFDKIKPIVKYFKSHNKSKKVETKDMCTTMDKSYALTIEKKNPQNVAPHETLQSISKVIFRFN